jgi:hypothetical protein
MDTTLEDFVKMTAMVKANGKNFDQMYARFGIDEERWQSIAMHWMGRLGNDPQLGQQFQSMMLAELARLEGAGLSP